MSRQSDINSKPNSMDNDNLETNIPQESGDDIFGCRNLFQPPWIRHSFQDGDGLDRFLLDYYFHILLRFSILLWVIFFIQKII
jgi:hypothetical protein